MQKNKNNNTYNALIKPIEYISLDNFSIIAKENVNYILEIKESLVILRIAQRVW